MTDLIDRDALREALTRAQFMSGEGTAPLLQLGTALSILDAAPAVTCDWCRWQEKGAMDPDSCGVLQGFIPCRDFVCNQWRAK